MADIDLLFGVAGGGDVAGESGSLIKSQLESIIKGIEPLKVKVGIDVEASKKDFAADVESLFKGASKTIKLKLDAHDIGKPLSDGAIDKSIKKSALSFEKAESIAKNYYDTLRQVNEANKSGMVLELQTDGTVKALSKEFEELAERSNQAQKEMDALRKAVYSLPDTQKKKIQNMLKVEDGDYRSNMFPTPAATENSIKSVTSELKEQVYTYKEAESAIKKYNEVISAVTKNNADIEWDVIYGKYASKSGAFNQHAESLNETEAAYNRVVDAMHLMPFEDQIRLQKLMNQEVERYNIALEGSAGKERYTFDYNDSVRAVKDYYKTLSTLERNFDAKTHVSLQEIEPGSGKYEYRSDTKDYEELASALNRTKTAFDAVVAARSELLGDKQARLQTLMAQEAQKYSLLVEDQANKIRLSADTTAAKDKKKAEANALKYEREQINHAKEVLKEYYDLQLEFGESGSDLFINADGAFESASGDFAEYAKEVNRVTDAFNELQRSKASMSKSTLEEVIREELAVLDDYNLKLEQRRNEQKKLSQAKQQKSDAQTALKAEADAYKNAENAIVDFYKAQRDVVAKNADIDMGEDGRYYSLSGEYTELAERLNRTQEAFTGVERAMKSMTPENQTKLIQLLTSETNELCEAVENQVRQENAAAKASAESARLAAEAAEQKVAAQNKIKAEAEQYEYLERVIRDYYKAQNDLISDKSGVQLDADTGKYSLENGVSSAFTDRLNRTAVAYQDIENAIKALPIEQQVKLNALIDEYVQRLREASQAKQQQSDAKDALKDEADAYEKATLDLKEYYKALTEALKFRNEIRQSDDGTWETDNNNLQAFVDRLNSATTAYKQAEEAAARLSAENKDAFSADKAKAVQAYNEAVQAQNRKDIDAGYAKKEADAKRYAAQVEKVNNLLLKTKKQLNDFAAAKTGKSSDSYRGLEQTCNVLEEMAAELRDAGHAVDDLDSRFDDASASAKKFASNIELAGENTKSIKSKLGDLMNALGFSFTYAEVFQKAIEIGRKMFETVTEVDTAMTELKKVTDEADSTYTRFLENAKSRAHGLGATVADTVSATADFARLGHTLTDATSLADAAIVYKNVGDGIEDISVASESIISTMQAFGVEAKDAMSIVDSFNNVGNNFAISSKGIGDALLNSAASLHAAGNDIHESIALIAAANTTIQDPAKVGTALKTMSMYLRAAKTEAEEAGLSTENMANSVSELRDELMALTGGKVDIMANVDTGEYKSTVDILRDLSVVWGDLSDTTRTNITELIGGGVRNANIISALMQNFSIVEDALQTSMESAGSALAENDKYLDSVAGKTAQLQSSLESLSTTVLSSGLVKDFVTLLDVLTRIATVIADVAFDNFFTTISTLAIGGGAFKLFKDLD